MDHFSDCAVHRLPAYPAGPCNCGVDELREQVARVICREEMSPFFEESELDARVNEVWQEYTHMADAAISAVLAWQSVQQEPGSGGER